MQKDNKKTNKFIISAKIVQKSLAVIMVVTLLLLVFIQVVLRELNLPLMGIEELIMFPTIWLYMLGSANASEERTQITVDIVETFVANPTFIAIFNFLRDVISLFIALILTYWLYGFFYQSITVWKLSPLISVPMFLAESALFVGLLLMTVYSLFDVINTTKNVLAKFRNKSEGGV